MGTIELNTLRKEFGSLVAVNDLDLTITEGSYTMILGPSGCGKSTTLRMIAGLERPTSGDIFIDGNRVTDYPPRERNLSMVFQSLALWDHKTVRENIAFGLKMDDVPKAEREAAVDEVAEILHIEDKLDQSPASLSGGQQQRVALGRSLVREPDVILLDEPLSSLDAKLRLEMRAELSRIQQRIGTTFVHVTHNQEDAMSIADEIILLNDGELQQFGNPLELFEAPNNEFVANFIGTPSMNLMDATVDAGNATITTDGFALSVPDAICARAGADRVRLGMRPSNIRPVTNGEADDGPSFEATVSMVETFGDANWYYLDTGTDAELVMKSADEEHVRSISAGDELTVGVRPDAIHLFDTDSGEAYS
ncbi:ABC transporter ATP-binding protein [Halomicroarcula sp. GCM10025324]|uniref:ABC transporter ATP-binding protein n=1 Tax=Haloarcula TaxID=2237 RepID=UPI0023E7BCA1|nr:ABC transporter ATP-binding protein [Halomicroarcula sp. ZS-22-S1]